MSGTVNNGKLYRFAEKQKNNSHSKKNKVMTATALEAPLKKAGNLVNKFDLPPAQKSFNSIKNVICLMTDRHSVKNSENLVTVLEDIKSKALPYKAGHELNVKAAKKSFENLKDNLLKINQFFSNFNSIFDGGAEIKIDDPNTQNLLNNLGDARDLLSHITESLALLIEVQEAKNVISKGKAKKYSFEELKSFVEAA